MSCGVTLKLLCVGDLCRLGQPDDGLHALLQGTDGAAVDGLAGLVLDGGHA
jgi:hypothetical protein